MAAASTQQTELTRPEGHLFLSPHYDDIPLSTGATVRLLANHGLSPETLVVFGSAPDRDLELSPFAQQLHDVWGLAADQVIGSRLAEERAAAGVLGANTRVLPFRDAIYRGQLYLSDNDLFGIPAAAENSLPLRIVESLELGESPTDTTRIYAPLGVGKHVDHQLVHKAAVELAMQGWDVWFYEDIPYSLKPNALENRLKDLGETAGTRFEPMAYISADDAWERKLDAILSYPSQLETVFRQYVGIGTSRGEIDEALSGYATRGGESGPGERFWRLSTRVPDEGS